MQIIGNQMVKLVNTIDKEIYNSLGQTLAEQRFATHE